ncbi:isochorismatase family protein [Shewanella eurypsychrophilus]|uniref:Isochorismatase family protein n=1 Tax=Shewanella eurypsychrophilus TaxID=2593656 RepID=A0ABX6V4S9_9GAMM|nr:MULTISPECIES: isochorismatase family protein [Shewanella]QFU22377.1 isochorismatase family protein [Shewanella sp. YLB-09]QPG57664.1 isochorismatase family protein [Shewanella eurypsychrophilus]
MIDTQNPAFINTELESLLREKGITELVICGVLINHSVA